MRTFSATLVTPPSQALKQLGLRKQMRLSWMTDPDSPDLGILVFRDGNLLYGLRFRELRDSYGSWIHTSDPNKVCRALGLPIGEPGIVKCAP